MGNLPSMFALRTISQAASRRVAPQFSHLRFLNLHEYQSKELMKTFGVNTQIGDVAATEEEALKIANILRTEHNSDEIVVKAQIHAGGRGKGFFKGGLKGGVHVTDSVDKVGEFTKGMLGDVLVTKQTGAEGQLCQKVLVLKSVDIYRETYFAILMDRAHNGPVIVGSPQGGMDIEQVAEDTPEAIFTEAIDINKGINKEQTDRMAKNLGFVGDKLEEASEQMMNLYKMFLASDCTQVEINPLAETNQGVICVDAKLNFDDNAQYRQEDIYAQRDTSMEDSREVAASKFDLNYIGLDGNIGCMVNGAGLAMGTMDIIKLHGGEPANFLDVGGNANETQVAEAFKILSNDPKVQAILVNIFGGIMKCDVIAQGVINAAKTVDLKIPLVVRLAGTNVELGKELLDKSGLAIIPADDLDDAAKKAVSVLQ